MESIIQSIDNFWSFLLQNLYIFIESESLKPTKIEIESTLLRYSELNTDSFGIVDSINGILFFSLNVGLVNTFPRSVLLFKSNKNRQSFRMTNKSGELKSNKPSIFDLKEFIKL